MLSNRLALVFGSQIKEAQTYTIQNGFLHENLHFFSYILWRRLWRCTDEFVSAENTQYFRPSLLVSCPEAGASGSVFRRLFTTIDSGICSVAKLKCHLTYQSRLSSTPGTSGLLGVVSSACARTQANASDTEGQCQHTRSTFPSWCRKPSKKRRLLPP